MPALDRYHQAAENALIKDGWNITHNPLTLGVEGRNIYIDLGAEQLLAAEKGTQKIVVEIKTFRNPSPVTDLQEAMGQFAMYEDVLEELEPERVLYLAIPQDAYTSIFSERIGKIALQKRLHRILVYDTDTEQVVEWKPPV